MSFCMLGIPKSLQYCWDQLFLQNELLVKSHKDSAPFPQNTVVIPQGLINIVLHNLHSSSSGGHMGINRTTARARERFFWPHMREPVKNFIQNCYECSQIKQDPSLTKAHPQADRSKRTIRVLGHGLHGAH